MKNYQTLMKEAAADEYAAIVNYGAGSYDHDAALSYLNRLEKDGARVLWLSRHSMTTDQMSDLDRIIDGPFTVVQIDTTVSDGDALSRIVRDNRADYLCAVLPTHILADYMNLPEYMRVPVMQSVSERVLSGTFVNPDTGKTESRYAFKHKGWYEVKAVQTEWL